MPPVNKNQKKISFPCFAPTVSQKRDMYPQLKMLLHLNGAIPSDPALKSFWDKNAQEKLRILSLEYLNTKYDSKSIFSQLSDFNKNLIQLTLHKCPTAFKKGGLLIPGTASKAILFYNSENMSIKDGALTSNIWISMKRM